MRPRQLWVISGVTDRDKMRAHATRMWESDAVRSVIHFHPHSEPCTGSDTDHEFVPKIEKRGDDAADSDKGQ